MNLFYLYKKINDFCIRHFIETYLICIIIQSLGLIFHISQKNSFWIIWCSFWILWSIFLIILEIYFSD